MYVNVKKSFVCIKKCMLLNQLNAIINNNKKGRISQEKKLNWSHLLHASFYAHCILYFNFVLGLLIYVI